MQFVFAFHLLRNVGTESIRRELWFKCTSRRRPRIMHTRILCNSIYACTHSCTNAWAIRGIDRQPFWNSLLSTRGSNSPSPCNVIASSSLERRLSSILPFFAERRTGWARRGGTKRSSTSIARSLRINDSWRASRPVWARLTDTRLAGHHLQKLN